MNAAVGRALSSQTGVWPKVLLIGSLHQENLALEYLAASLEHAGFSARVLAFNQRSDAPTILAHLAECSPVLIGIQFAFQCATEDSLWLARGIRSFGYAGHITAGGHVATFCYAELLGIDSPLDSIVRHEGERTLVEMVQRLEAGQDLVGVAGCVHGRDAALCVEPVRCLAPLLDELPAPLRRQSQSVVGIPIAFLLTSRGCHGNCSYCCINAFTRDAGGPAHRLRSPAAVTEELSHLAEQGVRAIFIQDDLFVLRSERAAIRRLSELTEAARARQLPELAFWIKARPESITESVLRAAKRFGAIHVFMGIENVSAERLRYLGRTHRAEDSERALSKCAELGVHASFNVMLFDPETSVDDIQRNLSFLERHLDLPWNVCRTEIYPGTHLFSRLKASAQLFGDFRGWGYRIAQLEVEMLFRILRVSLHERAFSGSSLHNRLISLAFAWQLHLHLFPDAGSRAIANAAQTLAREVHEDTVAMLRRALNWVQGKAHSLAYEQGAEMGVYGAEVSQFAVSEGRAAGIRDFPRYQQLERLWDLLQARGEYLTNCGRKARNSEVCSSAGP